MFLYLHILFNKHKLIKMELTEKQQEIINEITNEFISINEKKKVRKSGALLNLYEYVSAKEEDEDERANIVLFNKAKFNEILQLADEAIDTLNNELLEYGLMAYRLEHTAKNNLSSIRIYIDMINEAKLNLNNPQAPSLRLSDYVIRITMQNDSEWITFKSGITGISKFTRFDGFGLVNGSRLYKTIDELVVTDSFKSYIRKYMRDKF